jgi:hypothetical protein
VKWTELAQGMASVDLVAVIMNISLQVTQYRCEIKVEEAFIIKMG